MACGEAGGDEARLLLRTIRRTADFSGRSRRTEVLYYMIACALVGVVLNVGLVMALPLAMAAMVSALVGSLFAIPTFALFVRRVHDQDRSGWWGLLLPMGIILRIASAVSRPKADIQALVAHAYSPFALLAAASGIAVLVLCLLPGKSGPNRYGPDPRIDVDPTVFE